MAVGQKMNTFYRPVGTLKALFKYGEHPLSIKIDKLNVWQ